VPEVSNELINEVLKKLQEQISLARDDVRGVREGLSALRGPMAAMQRDIHNIYDRLDRLDRRVDRIEQCLEHTDSPA
jgi:hypothetical protein